ncbi:hypothetical protein P154DRAFT_561381, partial [Amniculicola lignicola CBS 123094]
NNLLCTPSPLQDAPVRVHLRVCTSSARCLSPTGILFASRPGVFRSPAPKQTRSTSISKHTHLGAPPHLAASPPLLCPLKIHSLRVSSLNVGSASPRPLPHSDRHITIAAVSHPSAPRYFERRPSILCSLSNGFVRRSRYSGCLSIVSLLLCLPGLLHVPVDPTNTQQCI